MLDFPGLFPRCGKHFLLVTIASALAAVSYSKEIIEGVIVYPLLYEDREDTSEKVLMIQDGYSLTLRKASVLSRRLLLQDIRDEGIDETYVIWRLLPEEELLQKWNLRCGICAEQHEQTESQEMARRAAGWVIQPHAWLMKVRNEISIKTTQL